MQRLLALDIGNSRIKAALFPPLSSPPAVQEDGTGRTILRPRGSASALPQVRQTAAMGLPGRTGSPAADSPATPETGAAAGDLLELLCLPAGTRADVRSFAASVNPPGMVALLAGWPHDDLASPRLLQWSDLPLPTVLSEPGKTGLDRLLGAVAASVVRQPGQAALIIDAGTATTVDAVSAAGIFLGGAILPGLTMSARALHQQTASLPELDFSKFCLGTLPAIGTNTTEALASGLLHGHAGAIRGLVQTMTAELEATAIEAPQSGLPPLLVLTGGSARLLAPAIPEYLLLPELCLQGLAIAAALLPETDC